MTDWWAFTLFAVAILGMGATSVTMAAISEWGKKDEEEVLGKVKS